MKLTRTIGLIVLLAVPAIVSAQFLSNPSFEGPVGIGLVPPDWLPFDPLGTPDTEPLDCDYFSASDGFSYITLVSHGSLSPQSGINENCQAELLQPLEIGRCYSLSVDLASREDLGHYTWGIGFEYYHEEVLLKIYGSNNLSDKGELLGETGIIDKGSWETYTFPLKPLSDINYITLEVSSPGSPAGNGNLLVDKLELLDLLESRVMVNDTIEISDLPYPLTASESPIYSWSPATGLSCYDCRSPEVNGTTSREYTCRIEDAASGCPLDELFIITIIDEEDPPPGLPDDFKIPNVFTPNGDLLNDQFEIRGLPPYSALIIYDRSGRELWSSENYHNSWDGKDSEGNVLPEGNYWYVLITPGFEGRHKGFVYLKRN